VRPKVLPAAKARDGGRTVAAMGTSVGSRFGAAGLLVVGNSGPVQAPAQAAAPPVRVRSASPKPDYRVWAARRPSIASEKVAPSVTASILGSVDDQVTVSVVLALSGSLLATFPLSLESTAADVLQRLGAEAPLRDAQEYKLLINNEAFAGSRRLRSCGSKDGCLEVAAFVVRIDSAKLIDHPAVQTALESFRDLPGHLSKPAHQRDWEFHDDVPRPVMLTIDAVCILLKIEKREAAGGRYGDLALMLQPLPLMDSEALPAFLSDAVVKAEDIPQVLALLDPILRDPNFGEDAVRRWRNRYSSSQEERLARTCIALSNWCTAAVGHLKSL